MQYTLNHSVQLEELDIMSKKILDAIIGQQDVFKVGAEMHIGMMALLQRQEQYSSANVLFCSCFLSEGESYKTAV